MKSMYGSLIPNFVLCSANFCSIFWTIVSAESPDHTKKKYIYQIHIFEELQISEIILLLCVDKTVRVFLNFKLIHLFGLFLA
jgi:hypothetical protein